MEDLNFYPDTCTINRYTAATTYTQIYSGTCCLQRPNSGNAYLAGNFQYQSSPALMLPVTATLFAINDAVEVTVANGRKVSGTVEDFETVVEEGLEGTTIWLKGVLDV